MTIIERIDEAMRTWCDGDGHNWDQLLADCRAALVAEKARADASEAREKKALADVAALRAALAKLFKCDVKWRADIEVGRAELFANVDRLLAATHPGDGWASPAEVEALRQRAEKAEQDLAGVWPELTRKTKDLRAWEIDAKKFQAERDQALSERDAAVTRVKKLEVLNESAVVIGHRYLTERDAAVARAEKAEARVESLCGDCTNAAKQILDFGAEMNGVKAERDHYESRLREVERAAEALKAERDQALSALAAWRVQLEAIDRGIGEESAEAFKWAQETARLMLRAAPSTAGWVPPERLEEVARKAWWKGRFSGIYGDIDADVAELLKGGGK